MTTPDGCFAQVLVDGAPRVYRVTIPPAASPVATVGSGDAFLAGYVAARYRGSPPAECLRFGVACGAESTGRLGAGLIDVRAVERLLAVDCRMRASVEAARRRYGCVVCSKRWLPPLVAALRPPPSVRLET